MGTLHIWNKPLWLKLRLLMLADEKDLSMQGERPRTLKSQRTKHSLKHIMQKHEKHLSRVQPNLITCQMSVPECGLRLLDAMWVWPSSQIDDVWPSPFGRNTGWSTKQDSWE